MQVEWGKLIKLEMKHKIEFDYWTGKNNSQRYAECVVYDGF